MARSGYFADSARAVLYAVPLNPATGLPRAEPEVLLRHSGIGGLDGSVCDAEGNIWNACWGASRIDVYSPQGERLRSLGVPARQASCPAFVGPDLSRLLVTSAWQDMDATARAADPQAGCTFLLRHPHADARSPTSSSHRRPEASHDYVLDVTKKQSDTQGSETC